jgi:glycosyltransferase involved in cell wall biosynthesis
VIVKQSLNIKPKLLQVRSIPKENRKRVLLLTFSCSPYHGSELGIGWWQAFETAKHFETWVIYESDDTSVKQWVSEHEEIPTLHFHVLPLNQFEIFLIKIPGLLYLAYNLWQKRAWRLAATLHENVHFDLVHQVNLGTYREPGYLWRLGVPFVWGPVGGVENYPWRFLAQAGLVGGFSEALRSIMNLLQFRYCRRIRTAAKRAAAFFTVNSLVKSRFEQYHKVCAFCMPDVGIPQVNDNPPRRIDRKGSFRILWSGSFFHRKALHLLLETLRTIPDKYQVELRIVGKGPLEKRWKRLARAWGVDHRCQWMPWLSHEEALSQYSWADVLVFSSLRDAVGTVVLEALSQGLPVICLDHQGVADIVTEDCGIKIPVDSPSKAVKGLQDAIIYLASHREKLDELAEGALARAKGYLWSEKIRQIVAIYNRILVGHAISSIIDRGFAEE